MIWKDAPGVCRMLIKLKPGEEASPLDDAPEGYRTETDDELRARIKAIVEEWNT